MSWQLGAFAILTLALAAGFAWYERSRPDARIVALVATLAALATLGRIAFAALPNVKPTTDIVLISGFALGAAPGIVVGALAGLVSNFFFGQGPWTVWQMAAWAATGAAGAGLAVLSGGRITRWPLALVCLVAGYAFAAFQDLGDWVTYSDHSLAQLGIYVGKGTGFDIVHAVGCLLFALAFGPWLSRALMRFRRRLEVTWRTAQPAALPLTVAAMAVAGLSAGTLAVAPAPARAAVSPTAYLLGAQNTDGGVGSASGSASSQLFAGWAALGLAAEGLNPGDIRRGGASLLDYIAAGVSSMSDPGSLERTILVAHAAADDPYAFGDRNLVAALRRQMSRDGSVSDQTNLTAFAVLALRAAAAPVSRHTLRWLTRQQNSDGGFGFGTAGGASDVDDTGAVLQALAGTGAAGASGRATAYIRSAQNRDGGLPAQPGQSSDAQSTAWAVQGLLAVGVDPARLRRGGGAPSPLDYLRSLIAADGHVRYAAGSDQTPVWVTAQVLMALTGRPLPLASVPAASPPAIAAARRAAARRASAAAATRRVRSGPLGVRPRTPRSASRPATSGLLLGPLAVRDETAIIGALTRALAPVGVRPASINGP